MNGRRIGGKGGIQSWFLEKIPFFLSALEERTDRWLASWTHGWMDDTVVVGQLMRPDKNKKKNKKRTDGWNVMLLVKSYFLQLVDLTPGIVRLQ